MQIGENIEESSEEGSPNVKRVKGQGKFRYSNEIVEALFTLQTKHWVSARQAGPILQTIQQLSLPEIQTTPSKETAIVSLVAGVRWILSLL